MSADLTPITPLLKPVLEELFKFPDENIIKGYYILQNLNRIFNMYHRPIQGIPIELFDLKINESKRYSTGDRHDFIKRESYIKMYLIEDVDVKIKGVEYLILELIRNSIVYPSKFRNGFYKLWEKHFNFLKAVGKLQCFPTKKPGESGDYEMTNYQYITFLNNVEIKNHIDSITSMLRELETDFLFYIRHKINWHIISFSFLYWIRDCFLFYRESRKSYIGIWVERKNGIQIYFNNPNREMLAPIEEIKL